MPSSTKAMATAWVILTTFQLLLSTYQVHAFISPSSYPTRHGDGPLLSKTPTTSPKLRRSFHVVVGANCGNSNNVRRGFARSNTRFRQNFEKKQLDLVATSLRQGLSTTTSSALFLTKGGKDDDKDDVQSHSTVLLNKVVGGLTMTGGIIGFITKRSKPSLISGLVFGGSLLWSSNLISKSLQEKKEKDSNSNDDNDEVAKQNTKGYKVGTIVSSILMIVMGKKYFNGGKYMPSGFIASLAVIAFVCNGLDYLVAISPEELSSK